MSDRAFVLERLRRATRRRVPHPGLHPPPALPGGWETFAAALRGAGGEAHGPFDPQRLTDRMRSLASERSRSGRIVAVEAAASQLGAGPWELASVDAEPHSFDAVEVAILLASVGVAENAAVAIEGRVAPQRALPFLTRHLLLLLRVDHISPDLHSAFARLPADALFHHHLTWISGPSKTADIEQTLVYGAQGPLTLDVFGIA